MWKVAKNGLKWGIFVGCMIGIITIAWKIKTINNKTTESKNATEQKEKYVREYKIRVTKEMEVISSYIMERNRKVPSLIADVIAYNVVKISNETVIPDSVIIGIISVESLFNPMSTSSKGAQGLMQVLDKICKEKEIDQNKIYEIDYNIETGVCILLDKLSGTNGDLYKALFNYVGGDTEYANDVLKVVGDFTLYKHGKKLKTEKTNEETK